MNKEELKRKAINLFNELKGNALEDLNVISGLGRFVIISLALILIAYGYWGVIDKLITGYFEILVTLSLTLIVLYLAGHFNIKNGFIGYGNLWYFALGLFGIFGKQVYFIELGRNIFLILFLLNIFFLMYDQFDKIRKSKNDKQKTEEVRTMRRGQRKTSNMQKA